MILDERQTANAADFEFRVSEMPDIDLRVTAIDGTAAMNQLFSYRLELCSTRNDIDLEALLGRRCQLTINSKNGPRKINGLLRRMGHLNYGTSTTHFEAELVPIQWLLTQRINSRVFQKGRCKDMSLHGIIKKIFVDAEISDDNYFIELPLEGMEREYVVQYRESDWDFICRLMEEEGVHFYFQELDDAQVMVITNTASIHPRISEEDQRVPYRDPSGTVDEKEYVYRVRDAREVQIGAVSLDDFDFKRPTAPLRTLSSAKRFTALRENDYPGGYVDKKLGTRYAQERLEGYQCNRRVLEMDVTERRFFPGVTFQLIDHPQFNGEYLVTHVTHVGVQPQSAEEEASGAGTEYNAVIRAIPNGVTYRPPRVTPKPTVQGSQTAIVVGPAKEEIHTDPYGRVKVQFHWDREGTFDDNSSCWIRVSQGLAGAGYGMLFLPRVGQEVIVDFLEGDPDQPIITGRVYNNDHMPPYKLPAMRTRSAIRTCTSPGGQGANEIRFEDAKDKEQLMLYAQRDMHIHTTHDRYEKTLQNRHETVEGKKVALVKQSASTEIKLDLVERVGGSKSLTVVGNVGESVQGNHHENVTGNYYLHGKDVVLEATSGITLKVGGNFIKIDSSGVTILGTKVKINSGGAAGAGTSVPVAEPEAPVDPETTDFGHNVRYSQDPETPDALVATQAIYEAPEEEEEKVTTWIEIELVDELGNPCPGEAYELITPKGKKLTGKLDAKGFARVGIDEPGDCKVSFPRLDADVWERI